MYRILLSILILLLIGLQYRLWVAEGGISTVHRLEGEIESLQKDNETLNLRNRQLEAEIASLKSGDKAMEGRARHDLGMVKEGEEFFLVIDPEQDAADKASGQPSGTGSE